jgi:general secretion pathway protein M
MMIWWRSRTARERLLLGAAATLMAAALIWQLVLHPAISTLETAKFNHDRAAQTLTRLDRIETLLKQGQIISPEPAPVSGQSLPAIEEAAVRMATELGLSPLPAQATDSAAIRFQLTNAPSQIFFKWVEQVEAGIGLAVISASLTQNPDGTLNAELEFGTDKAP